MRFKSILSCLIGALLLTACTIPSNLPSFWGFLWTVTPTPKATFTPTATLTFTPTFTSTFTSTSTPTSTLTETASRTPIPSATFTSAGTLTPSKTTTFAFTPTASRTRTSTSTVAATFGSPTPSRSASYTPSWIFTTTSTTTDTYTPTFNSSQTTTLTPTVTVTSNTLSPSQTFIFSSTFTATTALSPTLSLTNTYTVPPQPTATPTLTLVPTLPAGCTPAYNGSYETQVISLINIERANQGLSALSENGALDTAARGQSTDMAVNNFISHDGSNGSSILDRMVAAGYSPNALAENVAAGYGSPDAVVAGWMGSSGHRVNILGPYAQIGVGYAYCADSQYGSYWTADFGSP